MSNEKVYGFFFTLENIQKLLSLCVSVAVCRVSLHRVNSSETNIQN